MGFWERLGDNIGRILGDIEEWYQDTTEEGYSWFGVESDGENVRVTNKPREPRFAKWDDVMDPNLRGPHEHYQQWYPAKDGYSVELGAEFLGGVGTPPGGTKFIGHAPRSVFDSLTITQTNADFLSEDGGGNAGFSARLVQRDFDGRPNFISGPATSVSDDGVVYREDLRLPAKSPLRGLITVGGQIEPGLPLFVTLSRYGDFGALTGIDALQVQVTANLLIEEVR